MLAAMQEGGWMGGSESEDAFNTETPATVPQLTHLRASQLILRQITRIGEPRGRSRPLLRMYVWMEEATYYYFYFCVYVQASKPFFLSFLLSQP